MVMVTIALVMAVIVTNIYAKKESPERAPHWCVAIVSRFYPAYFRQNDETGSRVSQADRKRNNGSSTVTCNVQLLQSSPITSEETLENATAGSWATEKPEVDIENGKEIMQHADDPNGDGGGNNPEVIRRRNRCNSVASEDNVDEVARNRKKEERDSHRIELEWKLIAKFTDRVFFWIFLVLSVCVHGALILHVFPIT